MTVQYKRIDELPYIAPEAIEAQYEALCKAPDATHALTATRMARWAEAVVRMELRKDRVLDFVLWLRTHLRRRQP